MRQKTTIQLSDHFGYRRLVQFTLPSVAMMLFTSIYGIVDGFFVSNFVGKSEFAALNMAWPVVGCLGAFGFMIGSGGTALVSKTLGEGDSRKANRYFSMLVYADLIIGLVLGILGLLILKPALKLMGAEGQFLENGFLYGAILIAGLIPYIMQCSFQSLIIAAEKPKLGLRVTVTAGITNMVLDALFIGVFGWGLAGAAAATVASQLVGSIWPLAFFINKSSDSKLHLGVPSVDLKAFGQVCVNGSSEFVTNTAFSIVSMFYNTILLRMAGEDGVSAYGVIMYVSMIFLAVFFGYAMGVSPIISYHYGAGNHDELKNLRRRSFRLQATVSVLMTALALALAAPLSKFFVGYDDELYRLTIRAMMLYSVTFLISYINIFASAFFTALNNGAVSAAISFSRMFVFQIGALLLLPKIIGIDGVWLAMAVAEACTLVLSLTFFVTQRKRYGY